MTLWKAPGSASQIACLHLRPELGEAERGSLGDAPNLGIHWRVPEVRAHTTIRFRRSPSQAAR